MQTRAHRAWRFVTAEMPPHFLLKNQAVRLSRRGEFSSMSWPRALGIDKLGEAGS
jgi:hypothetical protein